jgi:hypothetical protein
VCYLVVAPDSDYLFIFSSMEHARIRLDSARALEIPPTYCKFFAKDGCKVKPKPRREVSFEEPWNISNVTTAR